MAEAGRPAGCAYVAAVTGKVRPLLTKLGVQPPCDVAVALLALRPSRRCLTCHRHPCASGRGSLTHSS